MKILWILLLTIFLVGCAQQVVDEQPAVEEGMRLRDISGIKKSAVDGVRISAQVYNEPSDKGILLIHMLDKDKTTWESFAKSIRDEGYKVIAMDLRGHGNSDGDWNEFTDQDFQNMLLDVDTIVEELGTDKIVIIGASIGANLALMYTTQYPEINAIVMLSPGEEYRSLETYEPAQRVILPALIVATERDRYSAKSSRELAELMQNAELKIYEGKEHGTDMLDTHPLYEDIVEWLKAKI